MKALTLAMIGVLAFWMTGCNNHDGTNNTNGAASELRNVAGQAGTTGSTIQGNVVAQATAAVRGSTAKADIVGTGIPGVVVTIEGTDLSTVTGSDGRFTFYGILPGTYVLLFSSGGALSALQVTVVAGNDVIELRNIEIDDDDGDGTTEVEVEEVYVNGVEVTDEIEVVDDDAEDDHDADVDENEIDDSEEDAIGDDDSEEDDDEDGDDDEEDDDSEDD